MFTIYLTFGIGMANLGIPKPGYCARKNYYQLVLSGQVLTNNYSIVPCSLPHAPTRPLPLCLTLTYFEQEAMGHHAKPREAEILCRGGLALIVV